MKEIIQKILPHTVAVVLFVLVTMAYFSPMFFDGKTLKQYDILQSNGSSKEITEYREKTGEEALWTNSVFGGMPAYQISVQYHNNWLQYLGRFITLGLPSPAYMIFVALLGFYIMLLCFRVNPWLAIAGAFAYGLSAYFMLIAGAGHNTKMRAMAYIPPIIGGVYLAFIRQEIWAGALVVCLALGLQIRSNHFQITYYTALIVLTFILFEIIRVVKEKQYISFLKTSSIMLIAVALAIGVNITNMLLTAEYTPYSTRGQSELSDETGNKTKGLDRSYILDNYSYGFAETFNLFIPSFSGSPISVDVAQKSELFDVLVKQGSKRDEATQYAKYMPSWGEQGNSDPIYLGAVVIFLFVLGLFVVKGPVKWWLLTATILSIALAWGKHFEFLSNLFIDYFPMYNKFRTVSMILTIAMLTVPLLGMLAVKELLDDKRTAADKTKALKMSFFITGGIALFFILFAGFVISSNNEGELPKWLLEPLQNTRESVLRTDAFRTLFFVTGAAAVLWFSLKGKLKINTVYVLIAVLIVADLWLVDKRLLNDSNFQKGQKVNIATPSTADNYILQDNDPNYRVLNLAVSTFNDATTSFFHKSLGGYHGAKMKRYQELIEYRLSSEINALISKIQAVKTEDDFLALFTDCPVINMLNTKYVIFDPNQQAIDNSDALGNCWTVSEIIWVADADEEIATLKNFIPTEEVVLDKRYQSALEGFTAQRDSVASINLISYEPNHLVYDYYSELPQLAVFSEIFYSKGWNAYIDGNHATHIRANYVLRAMTVPEGEHIIEFKFEPELYARGERIALISSIGIVLLILGTIAIRIFKNNLNH